MFNPYSEVGTVATGARFVGRGGELARLLPVGRGTSSRALVGMPRMGKTSLATALVDEVEDRERTAVHWIDVSTLGPRTSIVGAVLGLVDQRTWTMGDQFEDMRDALKEVLRSRRARELNTVVIFDEFDTVDSTKEPFFSIRIIREIIYKPHLFGMTALFLCRRRLERIEERVVNLSNLANVATMMALRPFGPAGRAEMIGRGWPNGLTDRHYELLHSLAGGIPYLLELVLQELWEDGNIRTLSDRIMPTFTSYFDSIIRTIAADDMLRALVDIANGGSPIVGINPLMDYGLCSRSDSGRLHLSPGTFSEYVKTITIEERKMDSKPDDPVKMTNNFYNYREANIAVSSSDFEQTIDSAGRSELFDRLADVGLMNDDIEKLRTALEVDAMAAGRPGGRVQGPEVEKWRDRLLRKLGAASLSVGTAAATTAVNDALTAYFGAS
ncbi:AAA family ATPase [Nocardia sp. NPDC004068]|uniref:AAA family ATPase n=1 Tax=Nocardia sp. NPDC004068 TaxID=3364303 RepID=UPI00367A4F8F